MLMEFKWKARILCSTPFVMFFRKRISFFHYKVLKRLKSFSRTCKSKTCYLFFTTLMCPAYFANGTDKEWWVARDCEEQNFLTSVFKYYIYLHCEIDVIACMSNIQRHV